MSADGHGPAITGDIARRAFDTVAAIQRVRTMEELDRAVAASFHSLGFDVWVGFDSVNAGGAPDVKNLFGNTHPGWEKHYKDFGFEKHDAMIRASLATNQPFFWSDVTSRVELNAQEQRVMNEASEYRLREGFVTPMHNLDGSITAILLTGQHVAANDPDLRIAAHLLSVYFGAVGRNLHRQTLAPRSAVHLTQRQLDCLRWVREGKSASDIGQIIGISAHTVNDHVAAACMKLGVRTRVQAVAEAALLGLLEL
ncbi:MAG: autoinducer binding domain-containing protein [Caulobacterales bacterium]